MLVLYRQKRVWIRRYSNSYFKSFLVIRACWVHRLPWKNQIFLENLYWLIFSYFQVESDVINSRKNPDSPLRHPFLVLIVADKVIKATFMVVLPTRSVDVFCCFADSLIVCCNPKFPLNNRSLQTCWLNTVNIFLEEYLHRGEFFEIFKLEFTRDGN